MNFVILLFISIIIFIFIICIHKIRKNKYIKFLLNNSVALENLLILNNSFKFVEAPKNYFERNTYDNATFFENISCEDYLIYQLQYKKNEIQNIIKDIDYNKNLYNKYKEKLDLIYKFGNFKNSVHKFNTKYLLKLEKKIFYNRILNPTRTFNINVTLLCSKINGDIYDRKWRNFTIEEIIILIKRLNNNNNGFYNDEEIWNAICRVERGKVSNKMRFSIYQRDGYKCRYCGRDQSSEYLEIDHIKPIAKGGKSTYENLQTLCRRCNKNKGDSY